MLADVCVEVAATGKERERVSSRRKRTLWVYVIKCVFIHLMHEYKFELQAHEIMA